MARLVLPGAYNPPKGTPRQFTTGDLLVLAYVSANWDDDPDFESIMIGLNRGEHGEEPFEKILTSVIPVFQEPPEELDDTWQHGCLLGGMVEGACDTFALAESYKFAGDILVNAVPSRAEAYELIRPVLFNYRHAIELYLKAVLPKKDTPNKKDRAAHNLGRMFQKLEVILKTEHKITAPKWFKETVLAFDDIDQGSTTFRYVEGICSRKTGDSGEFWIDLYHTKTLMDWVSNAFQRIRHATPASAGR